MKRLALALLLLVGQGLPTMARAEGPVNVRVTPSRFDLSLDPGSTHVAEFVLENDSQEAVHVQTSIHTMNPTQGSGALQVAQVEDEQAVSHWFQPAESDFSVPAHEAYLYRLPIQVPSTAGPGGRYISVLFAVETRQEDIPNANFIIRSRIGALFFLTVNGDIQKQGRLREVSVPRLMVLPRQLVKATFQNTGNVHIQPFGELQLRKTNGDIVWRKDIDEYGSLTTLPGAERTLDMHWDIPITAGVYQLVVALQDTNGESYVLGRTVLIAHPSIAIPLGCIVLLLLVLLILRVRGRRRQRKGGGRGRGNTKLRKQKSPKGQTVTVAGKQYLIVQPSKIEKK
jgi:hypothetical protein